MKAFKTVQESRITISELMLPSHSNFSGKIHGGYILSLMDQIAFACASKHSGAYCVTASVDKVDFLLPIEVGELVTMKASINYTGNTSMVVGVRVESENVRTGKVKHCNSSYFTMVAKDSNGLNTNIPGLILRSQAELRRYTRSLMRKLEAKKSTDEFAEDVFDASSYLSALQHQNVKLEI